jgi:hypothetical protein
MFLTPLATGCRVGKRESQEVVELGNRFLFKFTYFIVEVYVQLTLFRVFCIKGQASTASLLLRCNCYFF